MLENQYTKFTPFEKKALCAFGCTDKTITITNLETATAVAVREGSRTRLRRLIDKLKRDVFIGYQYDMVFYACMEELEETNIRETLNYQKTTGDILTGRPWKNYGKAEFINEFCCDNPYCTIGRLIVLREATALPEFQKLIEDVQREIGHLYRIEQEDFPGYDLWLDWHRNIVHTGINRKKKARYSSRIISGQCRSMTQKHFIECRDSYRTGGFLKWQLFSAVNR